MQITDPSLKSEALVIKSETILRANTATRVGTMLEDIIDSKINNDKISTNAALGTSNTLIPSQAAVKSYVDTGLSTKENVANKDNGALSSSSTTYPTSGAVKTYVNGRTLNDILTAGRMSTIVPYITGIEFGAPTGFGAVSYNGSNTFSFMDGGPNDIFRIKDGEITIVSLGQSIDAKITSSLLSTSRTFNLPDKNGTFAMTSDYLPLVAGITNPLTGPLYSSSGETKVINFQGTAGVTFSVSVTDEDLATGYPAEIGSIGIGGNKLQVKYGIGDNDWGDVIYKELLPKKYIALISQSGTANPTVTVIKNDFIGTISVTRTTDPNPANNVGNYRITSALGEFTNNKTNVCINNSTNYAVKFTGCTRLSDTVIAVATYSLTGGGIPADTLLLNDTIVIEVYP